jgi:cytochrome d ubiquinol oxidase subunit I
MQEPVGFVLRHGRAEMTDFLALLGNPHVWVQYPHVLFSGMATAGFFVLGISAWHLLRKSHVDFFKRSLQIGVVYGLIGSVLVGLVGHSQAQHMVRAQPMKMAAAEALYETENPASFSLLTIGDMTGRREVFAIRIPAVLSLLAYNQLAGEVKGINELQTMYQKQYGAGDYAPPIPLIYWTFRAMVGAGTLMILLALVGLYLALKNQMDQAPWYLRWLPYALFLPYIANTAGWLMTELGRQPWIVFGLMKTETAVSTTVPAGMVLASLALYTLLYGVLMAADVYLLVKFAQADPTKSESFVPVAA